MKELIESLASACAVVGLICLMSVFFALTGVSLAIMWDCCIGAKNRWRGK